MDLEFSLVCTSALLGKRSLEVLGGEELSIEHMECFVHICTSNRVTCSRSNTFVM